MQLAVKSVRLEERRYARIGHVEVCQRCDEDFQKTESNNEWNVMWSLAEVRLDPSLK